MSIWIGNNPTLTQKYMYTKLKKVFNHLEHLVLSTDEVVLKAIEAEYDKKNNKELDGVLIITNFKMIFASKKEQQIFHFQHIRDLGMIADGKDKNEWAIKFYSNGLYFKFDDVKKNEDTDEFFFILKEKIQNPSQQILSTVTHNFDYFLHAEKLEHYKLNGVRITPFLMNRDDKGVSSNGSRLLREKHPNSSLITEGFLIEQKKKGNFIVVDEEVLLYEFDQKKREVSVIKIWPLVFFNSVTADHFILKTEINTIEGKLILNGSGKEFTSILSQHSIQVTIVKRKWYRKILGYRSGKWWKASIASLIYALVLFVGIAIAFEEESSKETVTANSQSNNEKTQTTELETKEEDTDKIAEEQRKKEEAARLAEEQKKKEAARLAEEQRKEAEAARLAEEQKAEEAAQVQNVFYKNCSAVRAAGAAPIHKGEPGYSTKLDRDRDGIACDR
ncbi:excalibur calcium-binding domain-containing protein [Metabacillus dongyingensis]|uniref:excalibur calcium-binding domain-containing protein n=1 Tax=Metabacillus dongyingensis TaxID=2874282 RepID=UPI003B8BE65F